MRRISKKIFLLTGALASFCAPCFSQPTDLSLFNDQQNSHSNSKKSNLIGNWHPGNWYLSVLGGASYPNFDSSTTVNNNSGFVPPANQDIYTFKERSHPIIGIAGGYRWNHSNYWLPNFSIDLTYENLLAENTGDTITQYSNPNFTNYTYRWNASSDIFLAMAKLNLVQLDILSPYILGGAGIAVNRATQYQEYPMPGLTSSRISAGYKSNVNYEFAYSLGLGLDFRTAPHYIVSVEYQYQNIGKFTSGPGGTTWSNASLNLGTYTSNSFLARLTYLL